MLQSQMKGPSQVTAAHFLKVFPVCPFFSHFVWFGSDISKVFQGSRRRMREEGLFHEIGIRRTEMGTV